MRILFFLLTVSVGFLQAQPFSNQGAPMFHGARVVGNRPNTDFLFTLPVTGMRAMHFTADNLPNGLVLDAEKGIITGKAGPAGRYDVVVHAENPAGKSTETLTLVFGDTLCYTPVMGWNSWNVFTKDIDEKMLMEMADAMVNSGMRDMGYQYINIDDFWHDAEREADGRPKADPRKFPHGMRYLADYIHSKGLKLGIYSCAGNKTCGKCFGGFSYEEIDAKTYAEWGIDLLKYDYCFAPWGRSAAKKRYAAMGNALKHCGRSIVFSVCEWGIRHPWKWAAQTGGSYWRTTPDIFDTWSGGTPWQMSVTKIVKRNSKLLHYGGPGHWNDPDMLLVGNHGTGKATSANGLFKGLTETQYRSHFMLWCVMQSPLLASCDLRHMNEYDHELLTHSAYTDLQQREMTGPATFRKVKGLYRITIPVGQNSERIWYFNPKEKAQLVDGITVPAYEVVSKENGRP
ncbi:MAG: putative Ig domain-containing protein [Chitinophagales bacterium]